MAKKSNTKRSTVRKKAGSATKRGAKSTRARAKAPRKKAAKKKGTRPAKNSNPKRKKPTKAQRRATHSTRRKPRTGGEKAAKEIIDYFASDKLEDLTPKELEERKLAFLRSLARRGIVLDALTAAALSYKQYMRLKKEDEGFAEACVVANDMASDKLEGEARRRAEDGFDRPVIYQGEITGYYTDYSEGLMQTLLKGNKPAKFKERTEHSGSVGRPLELDEETKDEVVSSILGMIQGKPDPV